VRALPLALDKINRSNEVDIFVLAIPALLTEDGAKKFGSSSWRKPGRCSLQVFKLISALVYHVYEKGTRFQFLRTHAAIARDLQQRKQIPGRGGT